MDEKKIAEIIEAHTPLEGAAGEPGDAGCSCDESLGEYSWRGYCKHLAEALKHVLEAK